MRLFCLLCILGFVASLGPVHAADDLNIKAPAESAFVTLSDSIFPSLTIEDWVCGTEGAAAGQKTVDLVYRLRLAEQGFKSAAAGLQALYDSRKKAAKAQTPFKGLTTAESAASVAASVKRFPKTIDALNADLSRLYNELAAPLKADAGTFFSVSLKPRALRENYLSDKLKLASWEDDGAYQVWTTIDCYSGAELKAMQSAVGQALDAAMTARDEYNKTAVRLHDGQGTAYRLKP